jgi:hypothetical protein
MRYDLRPESKEPATPQQPVRPEVVTHVLDAFCYYVSGLDKKLPTFWGVSKQMKMDISCIHNGIDYPLEQ